MAHVYLQLDGGCSFNLGSPSYLNPPNSYCLLEHVNGSSYITVQHHLAPLLPLPAWLALLIAVWTQASKVAWAAPDGCSSTKTAFQPGQNSSSSSRSSKSYIPATPCFYYHLTTHTTNLRFVRIWLVYHTSSPPLFTLLLTTLSSITTNIGSYIKHLLWPFHPLQLFGLEWAIPRTYLYQTT